MKAADKKRCAIYTRKSSEEGLDQNFNSLEAQREACEAYVISQRSEGWTILPDLYDDGGFSGGNLNRPAMQKLLEAIDTESIDVLVVYKIDRLTRSLADFAKLVEQLDAHEVSIVAVTQPFNTTTSMGRLTLNVLLSFAQFEREITGERIRDKIAASKQKGMWMGGIVPLGYDIHERQLIANEEEARKVRHIYERYLALGSVYKLKHELHRDGIRSKARVGKNGQARGNAAFSRGALYPLLRSRIYVGEITHQGASYPGQHDPIIARELFDSVQAKLEANSHRHKQRLHSTSILAGKLYDNQENPLYPCHANKKGKRYRYYVSKAVMNGGQSKTRARWPAQSLEVFVRHAVTNRLSKTSNWIANDYPVSMSLTDRVDALCKLIAQDPEGDNGLRQLIASAQLSETTITITLDATGLRNHMSLSDEIDLNLEWREPLTVRSRHNGERRIVSSDASIEPDPALVKALTEAHTWYGLLEKGQVASIAALARDTGRSTRDTKRILNLVYLAPDIKLAILVGKQPDNMTLQTLTRSPALPGEFEKQRAVLSTTVT